MSSDERPNPLTESTMTIPSDSEQYSGNDELSPSPPSSSSSPPLILYSPPTLWGLLRGAAINLLLPFINGLMLGFGELFAHEAAYRLGWGGTKVWEFPGVSGVVLGAVDRPIIAYVKTIHSLDWRWRNSRSLLLLSLKYKKLTRTPGLPELTSFAFCWTRY